MKIEKWIYLAEARNGKAGLVAVPIERETEKTYFVNRSEAIQILGHVLVTSRVLKSAVGLYDNPEDALDWISNKLLDYRVKVSHKMEKIIDEITKVQEVRQEMKIIK